MGDAQRFFGRAQLRLMETFRGNLGARRQGRKRDDIGDDLALNFERRCRGDPAQRNGRVWRQALSDARSIGDGELVIRPPADRDC
jgi:hypothetical protein